MGDAKKRAAAVDAGTPWPAFKRCPVLKCKSERVMVHEATSPLAMLVARLWENNVSCPIGHCRECGAQWEAWPPETPDDMYMDDVSRPMCDNCAFRGGSREHADPQKWRELMELCELAGRAPLTITNHPRWFCCHKNIPLVIDPLNAAEPIKFDFEAAGVGPLDRVCAGFLRIMQAARQKHKGGSDAST